LLRAPRTRLRELDFSKIGMGDGGMEAIASVFHETCFEKLKTLRLSWYENVTDQRLACARTGRTRRRDARVAHVEII